MNWRGRRVLVTGHTGFKGAWLCEMLLAHGANVSGLALAPEGSPSLFEQLGLSRRIDHAEVDLRNADAVASRVATVSPEIVFHLGAQSLVRRSYRDPLTTWSTNVMGTAHLLDALGKLAHNVAALIVTTDKVYENQEWVHGYRETDRLGGHDPYAASKAATELVVTSWRKAFHQSGVRLATARAGNVIGGGDWAENRIMPDLARAFADGQSLSVRQPDATRPWQHVLEPLRGYQLLADKLFTSDDIIWQDAFNFGPEPHDTLAVKDLVSLAVHHWPGRWEAQPDHNAPHEAGRLSLSIEKARYMLAWQPRWSVSRSVEETISWYRNIMSGADPIAWTQNQIAAYEAEK